jgi:hypothetical protein
MFQADFGPIKAPHKRVSKEADLRGTIEAGKSPAM